MTKEHSAPMEKTVYDSDNDGFVDAVEDVLDPGNGIEFSLDSSGKGQYRAVGASAWIPFLGRNKTLSVLLNNDASATSNTEDGVAKTNTVTITAEGFYIALGKVDNSTSRTDVTVTVTGTGSVLSAVETGNPTGRYFGYAKICLVYAYPGDTVTISTCGMIANDSAYYRAFQVLAYMADAT